MSFPKLHRKYLEQSFLWGTNTRPPQSSGEVPINGGSASISIVSSMSSVHGSEVVGGKYVGLWEVVASQLGCSLVVDSMLVSPISIVINSIFKIYLHFTLISLIFI